MKDTKYVLIVVACCVLAAGILAGPGKEFITGATGAPASTPEQRFYADAKPMPDEVMYFALMQEIKALKDKDAEFRAKGETTGFRDTFYKTRLKLKAEQFSAVENAYSDYFARVGPINARAAEIIKKYRAQFPNGELKKTEPSSDPSTPRLSYEKPPPAPPELGELQKQKDQLALGVRDKLRQSLGQEEFGKFESALREQSARVLVPLNLKNNVLPPLSELRKTTPAGEVKQ